MPKTHIEHEQRLLGMAGEVPGPDATPPPELLGQPNNESVGRPQDLLSHTVQIIRTISNALLQNRTKSGSIYGPAFRRTLDKRVGLTRTDTSATPDRKHPEGEVPSPAPPPVEHALPSTPDTTAHPTENNAKILAATPVTPETVSEQAQKEIQEALRGALRTMAQEMRKDCLSMAAGLRTQPPQTLDKAALIDAALARMTSSTDTASVEAMRETGLVIIELASIRNYTFLITAANDELIGRATLLEHTIKGAQADVNSHTIFDRNIPPFRSAYKADVSRLATMQSARTSVIISLSALHILQLMGVGTGVDARIAQVNSIISASNATTQAAFKKSVSAYTASSASLAAFRENLPSERALVLGCCGILPGGGVAAAAVWDGIQLAQGNITTEQLLQNLALESVGVLGGAGGGRMASFAGNRLFPMATKQGGPLAAKYLTQATAMTAKQAVEFGADAATQTLTEQAIKKISASS